MRVFTSDEAALNAEAAADLEFETWNWRDGLHVGPVSADWNLDRFSEERAFFLSALGWDPDGTLDQDLKLRNQALLQAVADHEQIALVFGEGPRDQLQLTQILAWMQLRSPGSLRRASVFPDLDAFVAAMQRVGGFEPKGISLEEGEARMLAWLAFVSPDPRLMERQADRSLVEGARRLFRRLLRELPSLENGLSLTECQVLDAVSLGVNRPRELMDAVRETERGLLYNDWEFWVLIDRLTKGVEPLLEVRGRGDFLRPPIALAWTEFDAQELALTDAGEAVMSRDSGETAILGDRWLGGTKIESGGPWRWDYASSCLGRS